MNRLKYGVIAALIVLFVGQSEVFAQFPKIERAMQLQEYGKVLEMVNTKLKADPKNERLYYLRGEAYLEQDALSEARASFTTGRRYGNRYPMNHIGLGSVAAKQDNFDDAKLNFDKALEVDKNNSTEVMIAVAQGYLNSEKRPFLDAAEQMLYKVKSLEKNNKFAYVALGDLYLKQGVDELALSNYAKATEVDPNFVTGYLRAGKLLVKESKFNEAAEKFRKAIEIDPNFGPAYREMGELWYKAGKYEKALENYKKYTELAEGDLSAQLRYAQFLYLTEEYQEALTIMEDISKDTTSIVMLRLMGYCATELGDIDKGKSYLDQYFSKMVGKEKFLLATDFAYLAKIWRSKGEHEKAMAELDKAYELDNEKAPLYGELGELYYKAKDYPNAALFYEKFMERGKPKFKDIFYYANSYYFQKDYENAKKAFTLMTEKYSKTHIGYLFLGRIASAEDPETTEGLAEPFYQQVYSILCAKDAEGTIKDREKKDFKEALQYLGFWTYAQGKGEENCEESIGYWVKVQEIDPENEGAAQIIEFCTAKGVEVPNAADVSCKTFKSAEDGEEGGE